MSLKSSSCVELARLGGPGRPRFCEENSKSSRSRFISVLMKRPRVLAKTIVTLDANKSVLKDNICRYKR